MDQIPLIVIFRQYLSNKCGDRLWQVADHQAMAIGLSLGFQPVLSLSQG
jgi:hypothetical protein